MKPEKAWRILVVLMLVDATLWAVRAVLKIHIIVTGGAA